MSPARGIALAALLATGLAGCGGGGPVAGVRTDTASGTTAWEPGVFQPSAEFAARCETPRLDGRFPDRQGSRLTENNWLRSFSHELYLWFDEIVDRDPALFETAAYFGLLKTDALTPSGRPRDSFHFSIPTDEWEQQSQSGVSAGYGARWVALARTAPRRIVIALVEPGSPAASPGVELARGDRVLEVDGIDVVNDTSSAAVAAINRILFSPEPGSSHTFTIEEADGNTRRVTMTAINVTATPVQAVSTFPTAGGTAGYLLFNDHIATSEQQLIDAIEQLAAAGIDDLVLDVRYNGGGFLTIASQLAYMIAGRARTEGRAFETLRFNSRHPDFNPITGERLDPMPFRSTTRGFSAFPSGQPLPELGLPRVVVVTGSNTCSASESIMNSLRGVGVEVAQVGVRTCGKPYGTFPTDNCGTTWFTTMFQGVNDAGFGDYADGFSPIGAAGITGVELPGCPVADDFSRPLGDAGEGRLKAALAWLDDGSCPMTAAASGTESGRARLPVEDHEGRMSGPEWLRNRVFER